MSLKRKRVKIPEGRLGGWFMHLRFLVQRRIRSWRVFFGELHLFRNVSQAFRFRVWLSRRKAKKQLQAREVRKTLPKIDTEERLDQWFSMLLSPNKPASFWMIQFALILLVLSPLALGAYHFMRSWRIDNLYEASVAALEDDDLLTAWRTANAAHLMKPQDVEILRALRNAAEQIGHPRALEWSLELTKHPKVTAEDRLRLTRLAILHGERKLAEREMEKYERDLGGDTMEAGVLRLLLTSSRGRGAKPEALAQARSLLSRGSTSLEVHQVYWALCLDPLDPALASEGLAHLRQFVSRKDQLGREALRNLLRVPELEATERQVYARRLWKFMEPTQADALLCLNASHLGKPLPTSTVQDQLGGLSVSPTDRLNSLEIAGALVQLGRQNDAATFYLAKEREALSSAEVDFFSSVFAKRDGQTQKAEVLLANALKKAGSDDLFALRQLIRIHDDPAAVISLLERMDQAEHPPPTIRHLLALCYQRFGRNDDLEELLSRTPLPAVESSPQAAEQTSRLKALYRQDLPGCRRVAEKLVSQYPATVSYRYVLALCYHLSDRPREAYTLLETHLAGDPPACPSQRLVGAMSLAGVGKHSDASRWIPSQQQDWLLKPEKELMDWVVKSEK